MKGYACSNCGAKPEVKVQPPGMVMTSCPVCGRLITAKLSETETTVTSKVKPVSEKQKRGTG